jgi:hypothetical protein
MSRILRRPMFRGGRVDSRGTGITSGLGYNNGGRVGYQGGGQIGGGSIYGTPMGDRYGFAQPQSFQELQIKEREKQKIKNTRPYLSEEEIEDLYNQKQKTLEDALTYGRGIEEEGPGTYMENIETDLGTLGSEGGRDIFMSEQLEKSRAKEKDLLEKGLIETPIIKGTQKIKEDETKKKQEELAKLNNLLNKKTTTSEFERYFKEYLPVIQEQLKPDSDASKRAKFLELAKVGLGILSQPGGQTIGEVVGKAATPSIANLQNLMAMDEQALQAPKLLALQAAMKRMEGPTATQLGIKADRIKSIAEEIIKRSTSNISAPASYKIADKLEELREKGSPLYGKFTDEIPKTKKDYPKKGTGKHYYYTLDGELKIFDSDTGEEFDISEVDIYK